ncbi:toxin VasX [Pseudomonas sp. CAU 1711]|uniref:toxin VasX n=1 Tax=Pseudomonas sp. CAU 1711 TaxID=3140356 RepID=UPI0032610FD4
MTAKVGSLSSGPACEAGKLIVEVIGKTHPPGQRVVIYDETDNEQQEWLTNKRELEPLEDRSASSTLHIWPWLNQPRRHLWLEIEAEKGQPIRVPLMNDARTTPRQVNHQLNIIIPVVPMAQMLGISANHQHKEYPVLCRSGFLYLYYRGRLWRELEIRQQEGRTTYHDVRLSSYRNGKGYREGSREVSGKALEEIWLPARWNGQQVQDIEVAFAETQWPAARLNRMEQDAALRKARCGQLDMAMVERTFGKTTLRPAARLHTFALHNVPAHRPRDVAREWLLDQPLKYLHDLSGQYPNQSLKFARATHQRHERGDGNPIPSDPRQSADDLRPETGAWAVALNDTLKSLDAQYAMADESPLWAAQPACQDALASARERQIAGIQVDDGLYRMRHLLARINEAQALLQRCAQRAGLHAHHGSALLVQRLMVPAQVGGKSNPLHKYITKLKLDGRRQLDLCAAVHARELARTSLKAAQDNLAMCLGHTPHQHALGDHFSLDGIDYAGAFYLCSLLFVALARTPEQQDPLEVASDAPRDSAGRRLLRSISEDSRQPLHSMLWPSTEESAMCAPYLPVAEAEANQGDGHYRAGALAKLALQGAPDGATLLTLDAATLAGLMSQPDFLLVPSLKSGANALLNIWENLHSAMKEAKSTHRAAFSQRHQAKTQAQATGREVDKQSEERNRQAGAVKDQRAKLGAEAIPAKLKLYVKDFELLRSMLQDDFAEMVFIRRSRANQKDYFFFGLDDLPAIEQPARRLYGELLGADGKVLATTNAREAQKAKIDVPAEEHLLLAIPRNHRTAKLARDLNRMLAEQLQSEGKLQQAKQQHRAAQGRLAEANSALQDARNRLAKEHGGWGKRMVRGALGSKAFPAGILILEMWNVRAELDALEGTARNKSTLRARAGVVGAGADLVLAMEVLATKLAHNQPLMQSIQKNLCDRVLFNPGQGLQRLFGGRLVSITGKLAFQSFAGSLFVGLSFYDALHELKLGDDAAWGYGLMALGGLVGLGGGFFTAGSTTLLGMGPVGWVTLVLILAGAGLVWWLDDSPIEEWLTNGPFGANREADVRHLWDDPQESFYRLASLFAGIRISIGSNPEQARHNGAMGLLDPAAYHLMRRANLLVRIESNLPGLAASLGSANITAASQLRTSTHRLSHRDLLLISNHHLSPVKPLAQRLYPDALELFYEVPASQPMPRGPGIPWQTYELAVRAQIVLQGEGRAWHFPAPPPTDRLSYSTSQHGRPRFDKVNQAFWADEQTHRSQDAKR